LTPNDAEKALTAQWETLLKRAKQAKPKERGSGYNPSLTYGVRQICAELDASYTYETTGKTVYGGVELRTALNGLKESIKAYYNAETVPAPFEREFLK
jgi:hypothetical protein